MGIESLNSAVAAAGFAMVSEEGMDGSEMASRSAIAYEAEPMWTAPSPSRAVALIESPGRTASQSLGERVTGFLDALRPKG